MPPHPGEEGKKTLEGIDSDGDGIRDDIEIYIASEYHNNPELHEALNRYAISKLKILVMSENEGFVLQEDQQSQRAIGCVYHLLSTAEARSTLRKLRAVIHNTYERTSAAIVADRHLSGKAFKLPEERCP